MAITLYAIDDYYLTATLLITITYQLFFFTIAFALRFDKLTDFAGGTNFVLLAIVTLCFSGVTDVRNIVASVFMMVWGARLSGFLLFRILKTGQDDRFNGMRDKFLPFLGFWLFQMLWVWTVSLPLTILNSPSTTAHSPLPPFTTPLDILGSILFLAGLATETLADTQKYLFRSSAAAASNKALFMDSGLWRYSRHPNYFGEILLHLGIWLVAIAPAAQGAVTGRAAAALYGSVVGPLVLAGLLLFVSGVSLQERPAARRRWEMGRGWEEYSEYLRRTSVLVPMPRRVWERLPVAVKRTVGLEFPMYVFDPATMGGDGDGRALRAGDAT
ncbi:uncharacterized protein H6S33_001235 [Morchella sextelata]|uniref:uncharacterized protein n=1 Tax=Morchella sextelata TaxID=1174677 RepID=UPI001D03644E|nr:uncharacterized protein H6S33_001235 [Morchella sextelata]KAH0609007.1 hypothetical protein H6S33_001235 [Morchella sextelata]